MGWHCIVLPGMACSKKHPIWNRQASLKVDLRLFSILEDYHVWWKKAMDGCGTADFFETAAKQIVCVAKYVHLLCSWYLMYHFRFTHFKSNFADTFFLEREHLKTITSNVFWFIHEIYGIQNYKTFQRIFSFLMQLSQKQMRHCSCACLYFYFHIKNFSLKFIFILF